ncbi:MAG: hypothetical protein JNL32_13190 [Candidatus Kapabacteria bacterium]|nr:hypothetical protein [Candidatus Kapabacteria bacterium]
MRFVIAILLCVSTLFSQIPDVRITHRIDTSNTETRELLGLWLSYLHNAPHERKQRTEWNSAEKQSMRDADLTRVWVFQHDSMLLEYPPTILSIEPVGALRVIRTLFSMRDSTGLIVPLGMHRVYAEQEFGSWKLKSALSVLTKQWKRSTSGVLRIVHSPELSVSPVLARRAAQYCDSIASLFDITMQETILYVCESPDEVARIIGLDYFAHPPYGITYPENHILFSGTGTPWYPHELVHAVFSEFSATHPLLREGVATWLGGSLGDSFDKLVRDLQDSVRLGKRLALQSILAQPMQYSTELYTIGGVLCWYAYSLGGSESVRVLLSTGGTDADLYHAINTMFGVARHDIDHWLEQRVREYKTK